jgi:hypothetical protein
MTPPFRYDDYISQDIGVDKTNGRFGKVSIDTCKKCGTQWLNYFVEYEAFTASGRWFRAPVTQQLITDLIPERAAELLSILPWYFYGGSYFNTSGLRGSGAVRVDL